MHWDGATTFATSFASAATHGVIGALKNSQQDQRNREALAGNKELLAFYDEQINAGASAARAMGETVLWQKMNAQQALLNNQMSNLADNLISERAKQFSAKLDKDTQPIWDKLSERVDAQTLAKLNDTRQQLAAQEQALLAQALNEQQTLNKDIANKRQILFERAFERELANQANQPRGPGSRGGERHSFEEQLTQNSGPTHRFRKPLPLLIDKDILQASGQMASGSGLT